MRLLKFLFVAICTVSCFAQSITGNVYINEFMAGNVEYLENPDLPENYPDWIELYNKSDVEVNVSGLFLSDTKDNFTKWEIPLGVSIPSNGFLIIYCDNFTSLGKTHANFKLNATRGSVLLIDRDGRTLIDSISYGQQLGDVSMGRFPDGEGNVFVFMLEPSAGTINKKGYIDISEQPAFSHLHGFYTQAFQLTLSSSQPGSRIYYTLDGSSPAEINPASVIEYTVPINITGTSIVRAITYTPDYLTSESVSQTYLFLADVLKQPVDPAGFARNWAHTGVGDYEMDPEVVNSPLYKDDMHEALLALPTLSLIMDHDEWFGSGGIYLKGELDKRKVSIEMFGYKDSSEFQINGGVMIVGGSSIKRWKSDKLSMRISFDIEYGQGKLKFPVFEDGTDTYNSLTIDAALNNAWHYGGGSKIKDRNDSLKQNDIAQYTRDHFIAELQNQMGGYAPHGRKVHLYLNGLYWGMHWLHERPDEHFAAAYLGGAPEDYSVLKHYHDLPEYGNIESFKELLELLDADMYSPTSLDRVRERLDVENLINYNLLNITLGNSDWDGKNWYATCNVKSPKGRWRFHSWDAEHVMEGQEWFRMGSSDYGTPTYIHNKLMQNREYRLLFMDKVEKLLISEGPLTTEGLRKSYTVLTDEVYLPVIAESARWGDNRRDVPYTRDIEWQTEFNWMMNEFFVTRPSYVLDKFKASGIISDIKAPVFYHKNDTFTYGYITKEDTIDYEKTGNRIFYTTNLEDPIIEDDLTGGWKLNPNAYELKSGLRSLKSVIYKARATDGQDWSPLEQIAAIFKTDFNNLKVTEIQYDPVDDLLAGKNFEFIEFKNVGSKSIDLSFAEISGGIDYTCPFGTIIKPGEYYFLSSNSEAFITRYGIVPDGEFERNLSNDGDSILICDFTGDSILFFEYGVASPWPVVAHKRGYSIVSTLTNPAGDPSSPGYYMFSCAIHGSPGESEERCISFITDPDDGNNVLEVYPNPFMTHSVIEFIVNEDGFTSLVIYDMYGRVVERLVDENLAPGEYAIRWEPESTLKGMYIIQLHSNNVNKSLRIIKY